MDISPLDPPLLTCYRLETAKFGISISDMFSQDLLKLLTFFEKHVISGFSIPLVS